jgi:hypothetical protein
VNRIGDGNDNITDDQASLLLSQTGIGFSSLEDATNKENEVNDSLYQQIQTLMIKL